MSDDVVRAETVRAAAEKIRKAIEYRESARVTAVVRAKTEIGRHVLTWESQVRGELETELGKREAVGWPPSFVALAGMGHLEKPLNRLFAWWVDPDAGHGLARAFLAGLARRAGARQLADDVDNGVRPEVSAEAAVDDSGKMPDLLVKTPGGALLLENKHGAGETGDQFTSYPELLARWASEVPEQERRAVMCSRREMNLGDLPGWHGIVLHREVAVLFRELVSERRATVWARIAAIATAEAFEDREVGTLVAEARALLVRNGGPVASRIREMRALADALAARPVVLPWRDDEDAS